MKCLSIDYRSLWLLPSSLLSQTRLEFKSTTIQLNLGFLLPSELHISSTRRYWRIGAFTIVVAWVNIKKWFMKIYEKGNGISENLDRHKQNKTVTVIYKAYKTEHSTKLNSFTTTASISHKHDCQLVNFQNVYKTSWNSSKVSLTLITVVVLT